MDIKEWEMPGEMADRISEICKKGEGNTIPAGLLLKAIQAMLKRNGGGVVMTQSFDDAQTDLHLTPCDLEALMHGHTVLVTRTPVFDDRPDVVVQSAQVLPFKD